MPGVGISIWQRTGGPDTRAPHRPAANFAIAAGRCGGAGQLLGLAVGVGMSGLHTVKAASTFGFEGSRPSR